MMNNKIENEIDAIRINLYEKTKDMTPSEMTIYLKNKIKTILDQYGIKIVHINETSIQTNEKISFG